jgi:hypothetical protein
MLYPYCIPAEETLPVDAYAWLKNNSIAYQFDFKDADDSDYPFYQKLICFSRQQDAVLFALRWA